MAKRKKQAEPISGWAMVPYVAWAIGAGLWVLLAAALISYDPGDPPSHFVYPHNDPVHNWGGKFGAGIAYHAYHMLGPGVWLLMAGALAYLVVTAFGRKVGQLALRMVGVVLMAVAASTLVALWVTGDTPRPEGAGGLLALFIRGELQPRFGMLGANVLVMVAFWIGVILAMDQLVIIALRFAGQKLAGVKGLSIPRPVLVGRLPALAGGLMNLFRRGDGGVQTLQPKPQLPVRHSGQRTDVGDRIDEDAGGLGATESFNPDDYPQVEDQAVAEEEDEAAGDAPAAYDESKKFDPDALRAKIKQLPINFAPKGKAQAEPVREMDLSGYKFPEMSILELPESNFTEEMEETVRDQAVRLESAMQEYRIEGEVVGIDTGPVITLFEVRLAPGTKVNRISTVSSDLARSLKAQNIRVVPNTAGRDTIGIEVPNLVKEKVRMKELMAAKPELMTKMRLPMFLGKDASGNPLIQDLTTMPHMLIAGTTGSGKSVCMNSIIMSFLFTKRPDELKLVLVDPKMVEMALFKDIPHLMCPVVTEMPKAASILEWAVTKMDERYELLAEAGVRDVASYNALGWDEIKARMEPATEEEAARIPKKLPYMVFIIDELADLMMTNKEVESFIVRIAQKARAVGLHLILATQRPQANVVTGLIKSNMPCRVSFKVASGMDSRIVLDQKGAELLLGHGDMLFLSPRSSKLTRAQGTLVDDVEIRRTVKFLKGVSEQSFEPQLVQIKSGGGGESEETGERDELFEDAVRVVLESQRGSVSLLQRRLSIGYSRASRLIEQIAEAGLLGNYKGSQAREVLMTLEEWEAIKAQLEADAAVEVNGNVDDMNAAAADGDEEEWELEENEDEEDEEWEDDDGDEEEWEEEDWEEEEEDAK